MTVPQHPTEVRYDVREAVATVTIDGPRTRNALSAHTTGALLAAVRRAASDDAVRAVLITGAGAAFCAGADVRELRSAHEAAQRGEAEPLDLESLLRRGLNPVISALTELDKPVLAAIGGAAAGAGLALALACDLRIAGRSAVLTTAFTGLGLGGDAGISWTLPRIVGPARALAMLMLPEQLDADRAIELGLVHAVVPDNLLQNASAELAARLAAGPTAAYAAIKRTIAAGATGTLAETLAFEAEQQGRLGGTDDHAGAVAAFLRREPYRFTGR